MTDYFESLFQCRLDEMSVEVLSHKFNKRSTALNPIFNCLVAREADCNVFSSNVCGCRSQRLKQSARNEWPSVTKAFDDRCPEINENLQKSIGKRIPWPFDKEVIDSVNRSFGGSLKVDEAKSVEALFERYGCRFYADRRGQSCRDAATDRCRQTLLVVAKVVRTSLAALERTLIRVPDLNVVFYARDPRATALSRHVADLAFYAKRDRRHSVVDEARLLCVQMRDDLASLKRLERKYPGVFATVRYEDFVRNPLETATSLFGHAGRKIPQRYVSSSQPGEYNL